MNRSKQCLFLFFAVLVSCKSMDKKQDLLLWYRQPARVWEEALPLGNGTTGAMVWGGINKEHYALNDHTLWSGAPVPGNVANGPEILEKVRAAINAGEYGKAGEIWRGMHGPYSARYLPLGDLFLKFDFAGPSVTNYSRKLDLQTAISTVDFQKDDVSYKRETFISYSDKVMVIRLSASEKEKISFSAQLSSKLHYEVRALGPDHLRLTGKAPKYVAHRDYEQEQVIYDGPGGEGMDFEIDLKLITMGGKLISQENEIGVQGASETILLITEATSFNGFDKSPGLEGKNPLVESMAHMNQALEKPYATLLKNHAEDYAELFDRVALNLGPQQIELPTDERMIKFNEGNSDNALIELYFQYSRYLMISASRDGSIPTNLQGIWNPYIQPPWGSNYTVNINTEMNYWPAEVTNLSECHQPLFGFIQNLAVNGAITAHTNYGIEQGWCVHHNTDIWAKTSPAGGGQWDPRGAARWSCWPMGGAWFCQHLWEHYLYSGDKEFLNKQAWPLMKGAAQFILSWMEQDENGYWVTNPSSSPENTFKLNGKTLEISKATTMDMSIIRELFSHCIEAARVLGIENEFTAKLTDVFPKLYPFHIGQYGQLQEWFKDWDDPNDHHRHISHLFSLYPGSQISIGNTPELVQAAKETLRERGDVSTGWSMAWKVNWWARLKDGNHALKILKDGLTYIGDENQARGGGGTYANLFDAHPPFQIDGNFGGAAGIAEMLVQSHEGYIELLPALPEQWPSGEVKGLVARGGFVVDLKWESGRLRSAIIHSKLGGECRIKVKDEMRGKNFKLKQSSSPTGSNMLLQPAVKVPFVKSSNTAMFDRAIPAGIIYEWETRAGQKYEIQNC